MWKNMVQPGRSIEKMAHAHCTLINLGYKHTLTLWNNYCFSTATMDTRTLLSVTSYVRCVPGLICSQLSVKRHITTQTSHISLPMNSSVLLNTFHKILHLHHRVLTFYKRKLKHYFSYHFYHSVRLLWTTVRPVAEISTWQHTTQQTDIHAPGEIRTHNPIRQADPRLRPRGHRDRPFHFLLVHINPLNAELNPTCHLLVLVAAHHILHVNRIRVKSVSVNIIFVVQRSVISSVPKILIMLPFHFKILQKPIKWTFFSLVISYIFRTSSLHTQCLTPTCCTKLLVAN